MDELTQIIAHNISTLRTARGMTQLELAEKLNYSDKLVSKWERGDGCPNAQTLKQLSDLFGVTVDYLFRAHEEGETSPALAPAMPPRAFRTLRRNHRIITAISVIGVWTAALLVFILLWIIIKQPLWQIFVYALPASCITLLVFNSVWNKGKRNFFIIAALVASIAVVLFVALLEHKVWQIFLLLIPAELLVLLATRFKRVRRRR